ncbi:MAG: glycosyltransferase family 2 protein [Saprospiraceae bacterium]|nr:glycosyltransferase family 2 protein [Saprospiraceae bacterium]
MISTVIVAKNEERKISRCIKAALQVSSEVIVIDTGSSDDTALVSEKSGAIVHRLEWKGYGNTKNIGMQFAVNDWILSLDADEVLDADMIKAIKYKIARLFHREIGSWTDSPVHERLKFQQKITYKLLDGLIWHFSYDSLESLNSKTLLYAKLNAEKRRIRGKKASLYSGNIEPWVKAFKIFFVLGGWMDGKAGWYLAKNGYLNKKLEHEYMLK